MAMSLQRSSSSTTARTSTTKSKVIPSGHHIRSVSALPPQTLQPDSISDKLLVPKQSPISTLFSSKSKNPTKKLSSLLHSLLNFLSLPSLPIPTCKWLSITTHLSIATPSLGRKVTGTLFGHRRGHVSFAVQLDPRSDPLLVLELAMTTSSLVKEMSSGLVRIALECEKDTGSGRVGKGRKLFQEPTWTMYCNGRKCGYAVSRSSGEMDYCHVLRMVQRVSVGAGVIPVVEDGRKRSGSEGAGELLYMRARFERVVGSRDSEAFYMMNPDGNGGPELSIFLLRI